MTPGLPGSFAMPESREPNLFWLPDFENIEMADV
jgi:hypothetical protein